MDNISLEVLTPEKLLLNEKVESVTVPGTKGSFQVLKDHAPLISTIDIGVIDIKKNNEKDHFTTGGGTIEVLKNKVTILVDSIEKIENIDIQRAKKAKERAEERLIKKNEESIDALRAELALKRAINRIGAKNKYI